MKIKYIVYSFFLVGMTTYYSPFGIQVGNINALITFMIAAPSLFSLVKNYKNGLFLFIVLSLFAILIETYGVKAGTLYGEFIYSNQIGTKLWELIPWYLPFAYTPLVLGAVTTVLYYFERQSFIIKLIFSVMFLLTIDLAIDPALTRSGFWTWIDTGPYYTIPFSNFDGWIITGIISCALTLLVIKKSINYHQIALSCFITISFWVGYSIASKLFIPAIIGIALTSYYLRNQSDKKLL